MREAGKKTSRCRLDYVLTKQVDHRLVRCFNVRRPPLEAPELDNNLAYTKVRIPRRFALNRKKRGGARETPKTTDRRRSMTDPNRRCQVANAMVAALPPTPNGTCVRDIPTDMADIMLYTAAHLALRSKRPHRAYGWCKGPGVEKLR